MVEAELLFSEMLNCDRASLYLNKDKPLGVDKSSFAASVLKKRLVGEPIDYILGFAEFMGLKFKVSRQVLIPRPETEILVEAALRYVSRHKAQVKRTNILDLGTGSGCIAISLAKFLPQAKVDALDISKSALKIAEENADLNKVKINFLESDLFKSADLNNIQYDMIVSNPPYVRSLDIVGLQPEIQFEPNIALDGGFDGLDFYRRIIKHSPKYLAKGAFLILEIGFGQARDIKDIFQKSGNFEIIEVIKDYNNIDRVVVGKVNTKS